MAARRRHSLFFSFSFSNSSVGLSGSVFVEWRGYDGGRIQTRQHMVWCREQSPQLVVVVYSVSVLVFVIYGCVWFGWLEVL